MADSGDDFPMPHPDCALPPMTQHELRLCAIYASHLIEYHWDGVQAIRDDWLRERMAANRKIIRLI